MQQGDRSFALMAAVAAIASLPLAAGNLLAMLATVRFNLGGMTNPLVLLHAGAGEAGLWRWSMVLDIVGYYLPIIPVILLLRSSLRLRGPLWTDLFALCLLSYCLIGAIGGAVACLIDSAGTALNIDSVASIGLIIYLVLAPVWACWLGVRVLRRLSVGHSAVPGHPDLSAARSERPTSADRNYGKAWPA